MLFLSSNSNESLYGDEYREYLLKRPAVPKVEGYVTERTR